MYEHLSVSLYSTALTDLLYPALTPIASCVQVLDSEFTEDNRARCAEAAKPLLEAVDELSAFASSPEFASVPAKTLAIHSFEQAKKSKANTHNFTMKVCVPQISMFPLCLGSPGSGAHPVIWQGHPRGRL